MESHFEVQDPGVAQWMTQVRISEVSSLETMEEDQMLW